MPLTTSEGHKDKKQSRTEVSDRLILEVRNFADCLTFTVLFVVVSCVMGYPPVISAV